MAHVMTSNEVAKYLKVHRDTVIRYAKEGTIPAAKIGRHWRFDKDVIDSWLRGDKWVRKTAC